MDTTIALVVPLRDASALGMSKLHAEWSALDIDYRLAAAEDLAGIGEQFHAVLNIEVADHVENLSVFLPVCGKLVRPGGLMDRMKSCGP